MKATELKELSVEQLQEKLDKSVKDLCALKLRHAVSPIENPSSIRLARKDIARMETELRARELNNNK